MLKILLIILFTVYTSTTYAALSDYVPGMQDSQDVTNLSQNELLVYPNPAESGRVTLEMNSGEISEVRLINIVGKEVLTRILDAGTTKFILPLDNLPDGIYFVRVKSSENNIVVKKLVVASR